jgi:hypothetical protein
MSGTNTNMTLTTDIYDIESYVDAIKSKYIDIPEDTLTMGIYGYLSEIMSNTIENTTIMAARYANESAPTRAKFERNVLSHALSLGINSIRAVPAVMQVFLCFPEQILIENMKNNRFAFDRGFDIFIGDNNNYIYRTDYNIIIHRNLLPSGKYVYTAMYDFDTKEKNETSDIINPYLPTIGLMSTGATNLVMVPTLIRQVSHTQIFKTIIINNPLESKTITFNFEDQLAYFNLVVQEGDKVHYLKPIYDGLTDDTGAEYCNYMYLDASRIRIRFNRNSYQPRANANITINVYTTKGTACNFSYKQDKIVRLSSEKFSYDSNLWMLVRPITDSQFAKDRDTVDEIKRKIPKQMLMRGSVTTSTDLNNYFNFLNSENRRLYFLEKVHNQIERVYYSYLILKDDLNILPTNTLDVKVAKSIFSNINAINYVIAPGTKFYCDPEKEITEATSTTDPDTIKFMDKNGFLYINPFLTLINKNPFFTEYYLNILDYTKTLNFEYINELCEVQFIATYVQMQRLFYTKRDTYTMTLTLEQNVAEDFQLVDKDNDGTIIRCAVDVYAVIFESGVARRYVKGVIQEFDEETYNYIYTFEFSTNDTISKTSKLTITGMKEIGTGMTTLTYLPRNIEVKFYVLAKLTNEFGRSHSADNYIPNLNGYSLCNIYGVFGGIDLYYDYTDLMTSYTTLFQNENKSYSYIIKKMPLLRYSYMNTEERILKFVKLLETNKLYLESALVLLEDSFGIDFKFFNTYGPSKLYNIDNEKLLNRTNLSLTFEVKFVMASDTYITSDISKDIKVYLEDINTINDLHMPNLITYITNKYRNQLVYFKFIDLNGYGPIKQSMYREDIDAFVESTTVPEFLNVNILNNGDPDIQYKIIS